MPENARTGTIETQKQIFSELSEQVNFLESCIEPKNSKGDLFGAANAFCEQKDLKN